MCLQFGFVIFWRKDFSAKAAHKMLVKLTPGVNFSNILRAAFLYESFLCSFYVLTNWACNFLAKGFWRKATHKLLVKLTPGGSMSPRYVM